MLHDNAVNFSPLVHFFYSLPLINLGKTHYVGLVLSLCYSISRRYIVLSECLCPYKTLMLKIKCPKWSCWWVEPLEHAYIIKMEPSWMASVSYKRGSWDSGFNKRTQQEVCYKSKGASPKRNHGGAFSQPSELWEIHFYCSWVNQSVVFCGSNPNRLR